MFKSVADRLGFPHSHHHHSSSNASSHPSSSPSTSNIPTINNGSGPNHRTTLFSSTSSSRAPSRQQQHNSSSRHASPVSSASVAAVQYHTYVSRPTNTTSMPATITTTPRKSSLSVSQKPVLPPLSFHNTRDNNLALSMVNAGVDLEDSSTSRAAENVIVTVRLRPFSISELKAAGREPMEVWAVHDNSRISYSEDYSMRERRAAVDYSYDHALTGSDNELIYNTSVKSLVQSTMEGFNGTVFAYGQTSSGKTYSGTEKQPGIISRAVEDIFKYIRENPEREFLLRVSYLEIYKESIRDLLSPEAIDLRIHEDRKGGIYVSPLKEEIVTTPSQAMRIIQRGDYQRHTSSTDYNAHSSRSHSIFQIVVESRERAPTAPLSPTGRKMSFGQKSPSAVRVSQLNLIDLAGSEKASSDIERRKEGAFINKSLLALGTVISKTHIPYRDSKLTRLLQSSLSGNARVSVICTISPALQNVEESHNTLKFAARVKKVVTKAHTNQVMDDKALLEKYRREISELRAQLLLMAAQAADGADGGIVHGSGQHVELSDLLAKERLKHEEEMIEMNMVRNALKERIDHLTKLILTSQSIDARTGAASSGQVPMGRYTVETSADGSLMEFPKEIETRLARKDTIVRQLQSELEAQQEKVALMKSVLQKTAKGETVDIERTLARVEMEPREKFLIEKRASIRNLNGLMWQDGATGSTASAKRLSKEIHPTIVAGGDNGVSNQVITHQRSSSGGNHDEGKDDSLELLESEHLAIDDEEEDEDLMDTPWNRAELISLRQAKRELEIVVIEQEKKLEEQEKKLEEMVAFEDSEDFKMLVIELEEQREKILAMEEEREGFRATIAELKNRIRKLDLDRAEYGGGAAVESMATTFPATTVNISSPPSSSPSSPALRAAATITNNSLTAAASASKIQQLEMMLQQERRLRTEERAKSMSRIVSLETEVTILKAEQSVRELDLNS
ncbi:hypothetical protein BX616_002911 [Lobosporangium transversale]|nr:hypothetical protein BX616_002911 [Lobosporangium transversale]